MEFWVIRHGQTVSNINKIIQGHSDSPLTEQGTSQARATGKHLKEKDITFKEYYVSDLGRTKNTFKLITELYDVDKEVNFCYDLREHDFGDLNGVPCEEVDAIIAKMSPSELHNWRPPNGETDGDIYERCINFFKGCYAKKISYTNENQEKKLPFEKYMLVSHCGWIFHMFEYIQKKITDQQNLADFPMFSVKNCSISVVKMFCRNTGTFCNENCTKLDNTGKAINEIECMDFLILQQSDISHLI